MFREIEIVVNKLITVDLRRVSFNIPIINI